MPNVVLHLKNSVVFLSFYNWLPIFICIYSVASPDLLKWPIHLVMIDILTHAIVNMLYSSFSSLSGFKCFDFLQLIATFRHLNRLKHPDVQTSQKYILIITF